MYIEELIIEGFKSYATRTVISGWDEKFNAITGLNGSGKSNIFDAIIFVLGAVNWSQLRAQSINNLIYKDGQTGIKKASVTIVFNNEDKNASPIGYEKFDQITVTRQIAIEGRSKYLINGHVAQTDRVSNLFRTVRLNMKNPHFLIMQGHISKVLNMKGLEILGMIEEAAGTKLYEDKRMNALKTIEKKDKKVEEINQILDDKINPTLSKLREQQKQYVTWLENKRDFERLEKFRIAYQYTEYSKQQKGSETELRDYEQKIKSIEASLGTLQEEFKEKKKEIARLTEKKEKRMTSEVHDLEQQVDMLSKDLVQRKAAYQNLEQSYKSELNKLEDINQSEISLTEQITKQEELFSSFQEKFNEVEKSKQNKKEQLDNLKRQLQAVSVGVAADGEGTAKTLADQLMDTKREVLKFDTESRSCTSRVSHTQKELAKAQTQLKKEDGDYKKLKQNEVALKKELESLKQKLPKNFSQEQYDNLVTQKKEIVVKIKENESRIHNMRMRLQSADFQYKSPSNNFDRSKVHGRVANLLRIGDGDYATALEVAAGGKLFNVVVDTEETGSLLLQHSNLKQRTTFIPLNKIKGHTLNDNQIQTAFQVVGKKNVATALSLVEYEGTDRPAMEYVFGNTLVCHESDDAKKVTFHKNINTRTVTKEGDLFDPSGTLSGGSRPEGDSLLQKLHQVQILEEETEKLKSRLKEIEIELMEMSQNMSEYAEVKEQLDLKTREIDLLTQRIERTSYFQLQQQVENLTLQLQSDKDKSEDFLVKKQEAEKHVIDIEQQIQNFNKEDQLTKTKKNISKTKTELEELGEKMKIMQHDQVKLHSELEQLREELSEIKSQKVSLESELKKFKIDLEKKKESVDRKETEFVKQKTSLDEKRDDCLKTDSSISHLIAERDASSKAISDAEINLKKYNHKIQSFHQTKAKAIKIVSDLKKQHEWIEKEEQFFGREHGEYDFAKKSIAAVMEQLRKLEEEQEFLSKRVNKKAFNMVEQAQQEYDQLMEKKMQIEGDKSKIVHFINELDEKKNKELLETYKNVDKDFGSIFSTLLPGAMAKLEPEKDKSVLEGVNIRVALGKTWKENLSELSGGQRSLLALSLVLALLLVNPAPMYILDEIDAALDLSHTQNIGEMLKTHFTQSQFIIISLKEGMFNNANVLFKVRNVNGSSQVNRIENRSAKQKNQDKQEGELKRKRETHK